MNIDTLERIKRILEGLSKQSSPIVRVNFLQSELYDLAKAERERCAERCAERCRGMKKPKDLRWNKACEECAEACEEVGDG